MSKLAIVGAGAMGQAIATGLVQASIYAAADIALYDIRSELLVDLSQAGFSTTNSLDELVSSLDSNGVMLIAVKPQNIDELLDNINNLSNEITIVSICAGTKIEKFAAKFADNPIIRVMPNTPAQIAKGASVLAPNAKCSEQHIDQVKQIFAALGLVLILEESQLDAVTALSGSGPAYVFLLIEAMTAAGIKLGLDEASSKALARQTVYGAANLVIESNEEASTLRERVTSPNGTTQAALESFRANNFNDIVAQAIEAARKRSQELS